MADVAPYYEPGQNPTCHANAAVTGGRFVSVATGVNEVDGHPRVAHTAAAARAFGVAARDTAIGEKVMVFRSSIVPVEAGAALSHGQGVEAGANGVAVVLAAGVRLGTVLADSANGALAPIALELGA